MLKQRGLSAGPVSLLPPSPKRHTALYTHPRKNFRSCAEVSSSNIPPITSMR